MANLGLQNLFLMEELFQETQQRGLALNTEHLTHEKCRLTSISCFTSVVDQLQCRKTKYYELWYINDLYNLPIDVCSSLFSTSKASFNCRFFFSPQCESVYCIPENNGVLDNLVDSLS